MSENMSDRIRKAAGRKAVALPGATAAGSAPHSVSQAEFDRVNALCAAGRSVAEAEAQARAEFHPAPIPDGKAGAGTGHTLLTKPNMNEILRRAAGR